ncbi:MAG: LysR family transcriptional regulator [Bradymonadaceae bacterium]|nr:LysR family transcriptional regulator [Lujinxingiaceae bacterium]
MNEISNWDDIRFFLAVYRQGSLSAAARRLSVNHVTVGRRLSSLEVDIGGKLFERSSDGLAPTELATMLFERAQGVEDNMSAFERVVRGADHSTRRPVRLTVPGALLGTLVADCIASLHQAHPDIRIELFEGTRIANLAHLEADLGLRMLRANQSPGSEMVRVRRLTSIDWAFYAHPEFAKRWNLTLPLGRIEGIPIVGYSEAAPALIGGDWMLAHANSPNFVFRCNSAIGVLEMVCRQMGLGLIPVPLGERAGLVRLSEAIETMKLWLAVHPDLRDNPRIRLVYDFIVQYIDSLEVLPQVPGEAAER